MPRGRQPPPPPDPYPVFELPEQAEEGREVVIDYKSGTPEEGRLSGDRAQVRRYCEAIEAITGRACVGVLWYIDLDGEAVIDV